MDVRAPISRISRAWERVCAGVDGLVGIKAEFLRRESLALARRGRVVLWDLEV